MGHIYYHDRMDHFMRVASTVGKALFIALVTGILPEAVVSMAIPPAGVELRGGPSEKIAPWLANELTSGPQTEMLILMDGPADLSPAEGMEQRSGRGRFVYDALRAAALQSQAPLVGRLRGGGYEVSQFWLVNAILVKGDLALALDVAALPGVKRIIGNPVVHGLEDVETGASSTLTQLPRSVHPFRPGDSMPTGATWLRSTFVGDRSWRSPPQSLSGSIESVECGVSLIKATDVWSQTGVRGEGIVLASMDTGVEWTHPAIRSKYRGWNGASADHAYSWHDAIEHTTVPFDDHNHGTHTTGTMVGDDGGSNQIGVAPGARWIACRNMNHGDGQPSTYLECMQWGLAPYPEGADPLRDGRPDLAADITNNSWGCPPSEGCDALTLQEAFENIRAAGQMTVAAAGNSGPSCSSVFDPPAIYDAVFSAGAVTCAGSLASFSSRGPVTRDGSSRLKPNIAAPGVSIRSSIRGGGYALFSGTSMASPHTAGTLALLWSAKPNLRHLIRISRCYLEQSSGAVGGSTAVCGGTGPADRPNNLWGWGLVNALGAISLGAPASASPDGDMDGIADACDCAPADASAFETPPEISGDRFAADKETLSWSSVAPLAGAGATYDVVRGSVADLRVDGGFAGAVCISDSQGMSSYTESDAPPVGEVYYYLVRAQNVCADGSFGSRSGGAPRVVTGCP